MNADPGSVSASVTKRSLGSRWQPRSLALLLLLLVGITGLVASRRAVSNDDEKPTPLVNAAQRVLPVEIAIAVPSESYAVRRSFTGEIAALRTSAVGFERSGALVEVLVEDGDRVRAGQPLARLDARNSMAQRQELLAQRDRAKAQLSLLVEGARQEDIDAARATVRDLEEQLRLQERQRSRREFLFNEGAISQEQLDEISYGASALQARIDRAKSDLAELLNGSRPQDIAAQQATVRQLEASIADLDVTIAKSTIRAPFEGIVAARSVDEGTVVAAGQPVVEVLERAIPEARVGVPGAMLAGLSLGSSVDVDVAGQPQRATVSAILPQVDAVTRTQEVVLTLDAGAIARVSPGQTVRLQLVETIDARGYWLPIAALAQGVRGLWNCYVVVPAGSKFEVRAQTVEVLHQEGDLAYVRGTIQPGDRVVADGAHRLVPGQPVTVPTAAKGIAARPQE